METVEVPTNACEPSEDEQLKVLGGAISVSSFADRLAAAGPASVTVVCGAGISVSAGIPDFRSPGTGLYHNLQKYNLPTPESIFTLDYFKQNPLPFFQLAKEMYPGNFAPTPTHNFVKLLQDKGLLRRCFTQNIDTLERLAGIEPDLLVEAHGSFAQAHCLSCNKAHESEWVRQQLEAGSVPVCCTCSGLVKPDIVFYGEHMPGCFSTMMQADLPETELLIVLGTSLQVTPINSIVFDAGPLCPRLLINNELVGLRTKETPNGFRLDADDNYRDVALLTLCDDGVSILAKAAGWGQEFADVVQQQRRSFPHFRYAGQVCQAVSEDALYRSWCNPAVVHEGSIASTALHPNVTHRVGESEASRKGLRLAVSSNQVQGPETPRADVQFRPPPDHVHVVEKDTQKNPATSRTEKLKDEDLQISTDKGHDVQSVPGGADTWRRYRIKGKVRPIPRYRIAGDVRPETLTEAVGVKRESPCKSNAAEAFGSSFDLPKKAARTDSMFSGEDGGVMGNHFDETVVLDSGVSGITWRSTRNGWLVQWTKDKSCKSRLFSVTGLLKCGMSFENASEAALAEAKAFHGKKVAQGIIKPHDHQKYQERMLAVSSRKQGRKKQFEGKRVPKSLVPHILWNLSHSTWQVSLRIPTLKWRLTTVRGLRPEQATDVEIERTFQKALTRLREIQQEHGLQVTSGGSWDWSDMLD